MRSTAIINKSTNISKDTAMEYRTAYRESAVVKNALQQRQHQKGAMRALCCALRRSNCSAILVAFHVPIVDFSSVVQF
jgi:hypothetical protein